MLKVLPALFTLVALSTAAAGAKSCTPVGFEVKFSLPDSVLEAGEPNSDLKSVFALEPSPQERTWAYFDTEEKELNAEGWVVRIRHKEGDDVELTYKKRFAIPDTLESAISTARTAGFSNDAEIDWTTTKQTLSFSQSEKLSLWPLNGTAIPSADWGLCTLVNNIPDSISDWKHDHWGTETLKRSREYGPVTARVWFGRWNDIQVLVEVLPLKQANGTGMELTTELSFEADEHSAPSLRNKAMHDLESRGWLNRIGKLKTGLVLERY